MLKRFLKRVWNLFFGPAKPVVQPATQFAAMPQLVNGLLDDGAPNRLCPHEAIVFFRCEKVLPSNEADQVLAESRVARAFDNRMSIRHASQADLDAHITKYHTKKDKTDGN